MRWNSRMWWTLCGRCACPGCRVLTSREQGSGSRSQANSRVCSSELQGVVDALRPVRLPCACRLAVSLTAGQLLVRAPQQHLALKQIPHRRSPQGLPPKERAGLHRGCSWGVGLVRECPRQSGTCPCIEIEIVAPHVPLGPAPALRGRALQQEHLRHSNDSFREAGPVQRHKRRFRDLRREHYKMGEALERCAEFCCTLSLRVLDRVSGRLQRRQSSMGCTTGPLRLGARLGPQLCASPAARLCKMPSARHQKGCLPLLRPPRKAELLGCRGKSLASQSLSDAGDDEGEEDISSVMRQ